MVLPPLVVLFAFTRSGPSSDDVAGVGNLKEGLSCSLLATWLTWLMMRRRRPLEHLPTMETSNLQRAPDWAQRRQPVLSPLHFT
jgi:hypothetical protein